MGRVAALGLAVSLVGCDYVLHIDHVDLTDAHAIDGTIADGATRLPICATSVIDDTFSSSSGLCPWGSLFKTNATVNAGNGIFTVTPTSASSDGGCEAFSQPFADGGVIAHITSSIDGMDSWTQIQALGGVNASIQINAGKLWFENADASQRWASTTYLGPAEMGWLRLRPDRANGKIIAEYSADAKVWKQLGEVATSPPMMIQAVMEAGVNPGATYSGTATFTRFIVCSS